MSVSESIKSMTRGAMVAACWAVLGRARTAQLAHILLDGARLDVRNHIDSNGERLVQGAVIQHSKSSPLMVFDVGAHFGNWTRALFEESSRAGRHDIEVHAFEPAGLAHERLASFASSTQLPVTVVRGALSDAEGEATFFVQADGAGSNSLVEHYKRPVHARNETVRTQTVDHYCDASGIERIDLLKIDAEGHDLAVVLGARQMLERAAIDVIQFEYNIRWINARRFLRDAFELLEPLGYSIGKATPRGIEFYDGWHPELESFREGNYIACRSGWEASFPSFPWWNQHLGLYSG